MLYGLVCNWTLLTPTFLFFITVYDEECREDAKDET